MNKSEINQLVSKVREVVTGNVSNNDIVMALHSYDMDVERTIRAFVEDGASSVLDDWVKTSTSKKNKKKKSEATSSISNAPVAAIAQQAVQSKKPSASTPQAQRMQAQPQIQEQPQPAKSAPQAQNGYSGRENRPINPKEAAPRSSEQQISSVFNTVREALRQREQVLLSQCSQNSTFIADIQQLTSAISSFGSVSGGRKVEVVKTSTSPGNVSSGIKHATSQSSLSSSVGADSGVNLSPTHQENKPVSKDTKPAVVAAGGINMSSDALSEEQLAALQRSLQEQLAARGIDASILSGVTQGDMPARRPRKQNDRAKNQKDKNARPQLSILNNA